MPTDLRKYTVEMGAGRRFELNTILDRAEVEAYLSRMRGRAPDGHAHVVFHPPGWYTDGQKRQHWYDFYRERRRELANAGAHIGYTMFETDRIDPNWVTACNAMDEIWVPTEFNRQTFAASGVDPARLHVMPLGLDVEQYDPIRVQPLELRDRAGFNFLSVLEWNKRKGYDVLLRAYASEFTIDDDVALYVRTYGYADAGHAEWGESELREYFLSQCPDPARAPRVVFLLEKIAVQDMPALYAACDSFVLPSRGEGWGLPFMEAMAMAKPTIGTRWSGQTTFMTDENSYLVDIDGFLQVAWGDREFPHEYWDHQLAEPSADHLRRTMREVFEDPDAARRRGDRARQDVAQHWTRANATDRMLARLEALRAPRPNASLHVDAAHVIWSAPLRDATGYADEARNFVFALDGVGTALRADPIHWSNWQTSLSDAEAETLDRLEATSVADPYIRMEHITPLNFVRDPRAKATIGRTMFETDGLPADWVAKCNELDEIWVPTDFNVRTFSAAGVHPEKLRKVLPAFNTDLYRRDLEPLQLGLDGRFLFLSVFDWIPRKGWDVLLRAYLEEFGADEGVTLVLKAYAADGATGKEQLLARLRTYVEETLGYGNAPVAQIHVVVATFDEEQMSGLYRAADAYVMATRGEGWGRPMMEAMAAGLPTIATGWGGNTEFMDPSNSYLIDFELEPIPHDVVAGAPWFAGQRWAEPSVAHLRQLMRHVFEHRSEARDTGQRARADVLRRFNRHVIGNQVAAELDRLLKPTPVTWEGSQFVHHSLAHINREVSLGLIDSKQVDLSIIPYEAHQFGPEVDRRFGALAQRFTRQARGDAAVHVRHQWPPKFEPPQSGAWVMIQPWEFGGLPADWIAPMRDQVDEIWVPSNWVRDCYIKSGVPADKVVVIPNGIDLSTYSPEGPKYPLRTRKKFKFLFVGGTIGRKGIDVLVETYLNTFTAADDVCLVLKAVGATTAYAGSSIEQEITRITAIPGMAEIEFISDDMTDAEVASLYRAADALVHPYRGEGFGMPIAEAMACGLPAIVTGYGAALDFCDAQTAYLIPAQLKAVADNQTDLPPSSVGYWLAEPDRGALGQLMRHVGNNPAQARAVGERARERMQGYGWPHITAKYLERIQCLAGRTPLRHRPVEPVRLDGRRAVAFLHHPRWREAGWEQVLASYCSTFSAEDDVTLVLLQDPDQGMPQHAIVERVNTTLLQSGLEAERMPDLLLVPDRLDEAKLLGTYAAVDWLVPNGDAAELERAQRHGVRVLTDLRPATWRAAA